MHYETLIGDHKYKNFKSSISILLGSLTLDLIILLNVTHKKITEPSGLSTLLLLVKASEFCNLVLLL